MNDAAATSSKTPVEIPYGIIEYTAVFRKPIVEAWAVPALLVAATLNALEPYGFTIDGVEAKTQTEKLNDYGLVFRRYPAGVTFTLGLGKLIIAAENLDWKDADQFILAAKSGIGAILEQSKAQISAQQVALGMHIQVKVKPRNEVTAPLLSPLAMKLLGGEAKFSGVILQGEKNTIIVDGSLAYANGLFVRINREHGEEVSLEQIAEVLHADEQRLFDILGLEGEL